MISYIRLTLIHLLIVLHADTRLFFFTFKNVFAYAVTKVYSLLIAYNNCKIIAYKWVVLLLQCECMGSIKKQQRVDKAPALTVCIIIGLPSVGRGRPEGRVNVSLR